MMTCEFYLDPVCDALRFIDAYIFPSDANCISNHLALSKLIPIFYDVLLPKQLMVQVLMVLMLVEVK